MDKKLLLSDLPNNTPKIAMKAIADLQRENERLKEENNEWREVCDDFDTPDEVKIMIDDLKECVKELQKENEELSEKIKYLNEAIKVAVFGNLDDYVFVKAKPK